MKILLTQTASIGDVILSTPLIAGIQQKHPGSEIWFLTTSVAAGILKNDPRLAGVISFNKKGSWPYFFSKVKELRKHEFDIAYAVQRSARVSMLLALSDIKTRTGFSSSALPWLFSRLVNRPEARHDVLRNLALLELENFSDYELKLFTVEESGLSENIRKHLAEPYVAIVPGSLWKTKRWKQKNFAELGKRIVTTGMKVLYLGAPDEKQIVDECAAYSSAVSLAGQTSLQEMLYIVSRARAVVCNDSSSLHMASAFKVPTVAIFCATAESFGFGPWCNPSARVLEDKTLWCRPCARHGGQFCPTGTELCREAISVDLVEQEMLRYL